VHTEATTRTGPKEEVSSQSFGVTGPGEGVYKPEKHG
jgi:hypothetical protein